MDDLISRQEAIDACHNYEDGKDAYAYGYVVEERLKTLPSVEPEVLACGEGELSAETERKKGKWIDETFKPWGLVYHPYRCDQCGDHADSTYDYCPNCGAWMEISDE